MKLALKEAEKSKKIDEVPIGAVIVYNGKVIARAHNKMEQTQIATSHAEILAINKACRKLKSWRLLDCEMYVTLEPCAMCAGAIANARMSKVYFGAYEPKSGCAQSRFNVLTDSGLNHSVEFEGGVMQEQCSNILKEYFQNKRKNK